MEVVNITTVSAPQLSSDNQYGPITKSVMAIIALEILNFTIRFAKYRQEFKKMVRILMKGPISKC
jgi:hypothetical protein